MRLFFALAVISLELFSAFTPRAFRFEEACQGQTLRASKQSTATANPFPLQLEMRVPFAPTAFPSGGNTYLFYELYLTNFATNALTVSRVEVLDATAADAPPVAIFQAEQLETMLQPLGKADAQRKDRLTIAPGQCTIMFVSVALDRGSRIPERLIHRVTTIDAATEGAVISTHNTALHVLSPPVQGEAWIASDGPSNDESNHHRRGIIVIDGQALDSRRYAIDWKRTRDGASSAGDLRDVHSYFSYGQPVMAVAAGRVVTARDGLPDNVPGHGEAFHAAVPITMETVTGNTITLDLGGGQFAYYLHLQPGSVKVKTGDRVRRGQVIAQIGSSGDAREPHLHFEVTNSPKPLMGEGVPYLIDKYQSRDADGEPLKVHSDELPLDKSLVIFGDNRER